VSKIIIGNDEFLDKVRGCWLGKNIGGTLGAPHEGKRFQLSLTFYDPVPTEAAANDDLDLQLVWLVAMEEANTVDPSVSQLASAWTRWASAYPWNEYGFFMRNYTRGLRPPVAGCFENYFVDEMGSPIRSEIWAILHPGDPQAAARMAWKDSVLDHAGGEGVWGEMFWAAVQAAAFVESDVRVLIRIGLNMIPLASHLGRCIREAVWCYDNGISYEAARTRITSRFAGIQPCNAVPNHGFTILGWLYGKDFGDCLLKAVNCGWDTDCTGATLGATLGIMAGAKGLPSRWLEPIGQTIVLHKFTRVPNAPATVEELTQRSIALAKRVVTADRAFGDRTELPANLRSRLMQNELAIAYHRADVHCGFEDVGGHEVGLHYGGEPVLRPGEDKVIAVTVDGRPALGATLNTPAGWQVDSLDGGRFRLRYDGEIAGQNAVVVRIPGLPDASFTILGPSEAQGFGAGDNILVCPTCLGRFDSCVCTPEQLAERAKIVPVEEWEFAGPFEGEVAGSISLDDAMPWEKELVAGKKPAAAWKKIRTKNRIVDLHDALGGRDWVYAYGITQIDGGAGGPAKLIFGSDDGIRIWLNGEHICSQDVRRGCIAHENQVRVTLKPGPNRLVVKVNNYEYGWAVAMGVRKLDPGE